MRTRLTIVFLLAFRNLRRNLRRTLLSASAMVLGGGLLIFTLALGDGTHESWIESAVRMSSGHLTVQSSEFKLSRRIEDRLPAATRAAAERALKEPPISEKIKVVSATLTVRGLASSPAGARPVQIVGVDPASESAFTTLDEKVAEGRYLEAADRLAAYVGTGLAESLDLRLGSRLVLTAQDTQKEIAGQLVRVVGTFRTGVADIDHSLIHIPLGTAGEWLASGTDVTGVAVLLGDSGEVPAVMNELNRALAGLIKAGAFRIMDWREAMPELNAAVTIDDFGNYLINGILFAIIALGIANTMLMSVLHRHREFGVLQGLGFTRGQSGGLVLVEGLMLTIVSGLIGIALGYFVTWYFFGDGLDFSALMGKEMTVSGVVIDPVIVPLFRPARIGQTLTFLMLVGVLASMYPAYRASRVDITEAMKFDR